MKYLLGTNGTFVSGR